MKKNNVTNMEERTKKMEETIQREKDAEISKLWSITMSNVQKIGNKYFVNMPLELLFADSRIQRIEESSKEKIKRLAEKWDDNKMDPIRVSLHPETHSASIIDGYHRYRAALIRGMMYIVVEILQDMPENAEDRLIKEAELFVQQIDECDPLTPMQKHKANCIRGIKENVTLQKMVEKYDIVLKSATGRGLSKKGHLAGFTAALSITRVSESLIDNVFHIICSSRWDLTRKGLSGVAIRAIAGILRLHPEHTEEIKKILIDYFTPIEPERFFASAMERYPERREVERVVMYLEDIVCSILNIDRVYIGGNINAVLPKSA